ncbi:hypothetical protein CoNPh26_CDS0037 [Staphylococcus phage S-CoN_Ph26]|nr:hypothetical protein CoNPh26_CDS0037 [Staphylococcus phage S-CoN_Ph26]
MDKETLRFTGTVTLKMRLKRSSSKILKKKNCKTDDN